MCWCGKPRVIWDPKKMEVGKEYPRVVNGRHLVAIKREDGSIDGYEDHPVRLDRRRTDG